MTTYPGAICLPSPNFRVDSHYELLVFFALRLDCPSALFNTHLSAIRYTPCVRSLLDFLMTAVLTTPCFAVCTSRVFCGSKAWRSSSWLYIFCVFWPQEAKRISVEYNNFGGVNLWTLCEIDNLRKIKSHSQFKSESRNAISSLQHVLYHLFVAWSYQPRPSDPVHPWQILASGWVFSLEYELFRYYAYVLAYWYRCW
jgi:hypothetical protein